MSRRKDTYQDEGGTITSRVRIPQEAWAILIAVGHEQGRAVPMLQVNTDDRAGQLGLGLLMKHVTDLLVDGDAKWIPDRTFAKAIAALRGSNYGVIPTPSTEIDIGVLHRNTKLKSGFEGVYANGQGFRAMSRDFTGKQVVIGTFQTAEEAAHRRLVYHRTNNLAYGELETEMNKWRKDMAKWGITSNTTDEDLIRQIRAQSEIAGTYDQIFGPGSATIEPSYSGKLPKRADALGNVVGVKVPGGVMYTSQRVADEELQPPEVPQVIPEQPEIPKGFDPDDIPPEWRNT